MRNGLAATRLPDVAPADDEPAPAGGGGPDPTGEADRRSHERFVTVFRLAKLIGAREEFCLIRNVSAGGLKAEASPQLTSATRRGGAVLARSIRPGSAA